MRAREIPGMLTLGNGVYIRPEEIVFVVAYRNRIPVPSGNNVIAATGKKYARLAIYTRHGIVIYAAITLRTLIERLCGQSPGKNKTRKEKEPLRKRFAWMTSVPPVDEETLE